MMIGFDGFVLICFVFEIDWICFYQGGDVFYFGDVDVIFCMCVWGVDFSVVLFGGLEVLKRSFGSGR